MHAYVLLGLLFVGLGMIALGELWGWRERKKQDEGK